MKINFLDLQAQYGSIKPEVDAAIHSVLDSCKFIMGPDVKELEKEIASYCGAKHAIACASGTDALILALIGAGLEEGDEVITTPFTFIATSEAVSKIRAKLVFVDIDERTFNIDPEKIKEYIETKCYFNARFSQLINKKTKHKVKAIIPVHLYGHPCDMEPIIELAEKYNLKV
ncbi:MAG: aminotransferase class I/II-fold pyridoxal phosphate-dependent enzyme, partial [Candidatus Omnitrophota bacterium]